MLLHGNCGFGRGVNFFLGGILKFVNLVFFNVYLSVEILTKPKQTSHT